MLSSQELASLDRELDGQYVLSVYVNGQTTDPAARSQWRTEVRNALDAIDASLSDATHAERESFATCRSLVMGQEFTPGNGAPGWIGFFTPKGAHHVEVAAVAVPTDVSWGPLNLAPYVRVLKESRPVLLAVTDKARVHMHRYAQGTLEPVETLEREVTTDTPYHMSRPARTGFHTGTRGETGTDAAQRDLERGTEDLLARAASQLATLASGEAWVVIGGIQASAAALFGRLTPELAKRAHVAAIDIHATPAQLAEAARESASLLRDRENAAAVQDAISAAATGGAGATGVKDVLQALDNAQVRDLFFTAAFLKERGTELSGFVRRALAQSAVVEHVSGESARAVDDVGGIAARLRYAPPREGQETPAKRARATTA